MTKEYTTAYKVRLIKLSFILLTAIFFFTLIGFSFIVIKERNLSRATAHLVLENRQRINDIQQSRVESCKRTYNGVREVFRPFYPKSPRTDVQKETLQKFNRTILKLQAGCIIQTDPKKLKRKNQ